MYSPTLYRLIQPPSRWRDPPSGKPSAARTVETSNSLLKRSWSSSPGSRLDASNFALSIDAYMRSKDRPVVANARRAASSRDKNPGRTTRPRPSIPSRMSSASDRLCTETMADYASPRPPAERCSRLKSGPERVAMVIRPGPRDREGSQAPLLGAGEAGRQRPLLGAGEAGRQRPLPRELGDMHWMVAPVLDMFISLKNGYRSRKSRDASTRAQCPALWYGWSVPS